MALCNTFEGFGLRFHVLIRGETLSGPLSRVAISPREGSDQSMTMREVCVELFLSTLPARGATSGTTRPGTRTLYFYPRSP